VCDQETERECRSKKKKLEVGWGEELSLQRRAATDGLESGVMARATWSGS